MAGGHCFHIDQHGHSVTVQLTHARGRVEVLVDGKVVGWRRALGKDTTVIEAELPEDPPRTVRILLAPVAGADGAPLCVLESGGTRCPMPLVPPTGSHRPTHPDATTPVQAVRLLRRQLRRLARRRRRR